MQFEEREDTKACTIPIHDDDVFEGTESFSVELSMPAYALLGNVTRATVTIADPEDEPMLQFDRSTFHVSESAGFLSAPVQRKGELGCAEPRGRTRAEGEPLGFACLWFWGLLQCFGRGSVAQGSVVHFLTVPVSAVKASWVWICFSSWHEQEQTFLFVCCFSVS